VKGENLIDGQKTRSHLWMVDLAGSERVGKIDVDGEDGRNRNSLIILFQHLKLATVLTGLSLTQSLLYHAIQLPY